MGVLRSLVIVVVTLAAAVPLLAQNVRGRVQGAVADATETRACCPARR